MHWWIFMTWWWILSTRGHMMQSKWLNDMINTLIESCYLAGSRWGWIHKCCLFFNRPSSVGIIHRISPCDEHIACWNQSEPTANGRQSVTHTNNAKTLNSSHGADCCGLGTLLPLRVLRLVVFAQSWLWHQTGLTDTSIVYLFWILAKQNSCTVDSRAQITGCNGLKQRVVFLIAEHTTLIMTVSNKGESF